MDDWQTQCCFTADSEVERASHQRMKNPPPVQTVGNTELFSHITSFRLTPWCRWRSKLDYGGPPLSSRCMGNTVYIQYIFNFVSEACQEVQEAVTHISPCNSLSLVMMSREFPGSFQLPNSLTQSRPLPKPKFCSKSKSLPDCVWLQQTCPNKHYTSVTLVSRRIPASPVTYGVTWPNHISRAPCLGRRSSLENIRRELVELGWSAPKNRITTVEHLDDDVTHLKPPEPSEQCKPL